MKTKIPRKRVEFLDSLTVGETVEVLEEPNFQWFGTVDEVAPELGVVWVRTQTNDRRLLDISEDSVERWVPGRARTTFR